MATGTEPSWGLNEDIRTTPSSPAEMFAAVIRAMLLKNSEAVAKILVGFIDCSDRAVLTECAGCAGSDGYSFRSDNSGPQVELKCEGYVGHSEFTSSADHANCPETADCPHLPEAENACPPSNQHFLQNLHIRKTLLQIPTPTGPPTHDHPTPNPNVSTPKVPGT